MYRKADLVIGLEIELFFNLTIILLSEFVASSGKATRGGAQPNKRAAEKNVMGLLNKT